MSTFSSKVLAQAQEAKSQKLVESVAKRLKRKLEADIQATEEAIEEKQEQLEGLRYPALDTLSATFDVGAMLKNILKKKEEILELEMGLNSLEEEYQVLFGSASDNETFQQLDPNPAQA